MNKTAKFSLVKRCKTVDKYDEVDEHGFSVKELGKRTPLLGTIYVDKDVANGAKSINVTVTVD